MYQRLVIVGNLGRDPEMRYTPAGYAVTSFSVAVNHKYTTSAGEQVSQVTWFRVSAWNKAAEACNQYLHKGSKVLVEGKLLPDKETGNPPMWKDKDGNPHASFDVSASTVRFLDPKGDRQEVKVEGDPSEDEGMLLPDPSDDVPW